MLFQRAYDKGDIYLGKYEGWYCIPDETFWPENKLTPEHICPDCGRPLQRVSEDAYFFKMSKYADQWLKYIMNIRTSFSRNPARMKGAVR